MGPLWQVYDSKHYKYSLFIEIWLEWEKQEKCTEFYGETFSISTEEEMTDLRELDCEEAKD
jgi:hypothetical protein